ncbi:MAG: tetratricopeptide repeat protein [Phycisphaerales bacterium]
MIRWMLSAVTLMAAPAHAERMPGQPTAPAEVVAPGTEAPETMRQPTVREVTARSLARVAMVDLKFARAPGVPEFSVAADLLELAHELDPKDEDILRLLIEATTQTGDQARAAELSLDLIRLDPGDTVAQLNRISANISRLQSVEERIAVYEQFLGRQGESFDSSIRSRLALDCALLHREGGNLASFTDKLALAAKLDSTNKEAAALVAALVASRGDPAPRRLESLILLLLADPLDANTHLEIARELAAGGANAGAWRFYRLYRSIMEAYGQVVQTGVVAEIAVQNWLVNGPGKVVSDLNDAILVPRRAAAESIERARAAGATPDEIAAMGDPKAIRLHPELERVWVLAASAAGDEAGVRLALAEMVDSTDAARRRATDPSARPEGLSENVARATATEQRLALIWARLLLAQQVPEATADLETLRSEFSLAPDLVARFEGWAALRTGDLAAARAKLEPIADREPLAQLGLAAALEASGDRIGAGEAYARVAERLMPGITGAWARARAALLLQRAPVASPLAQTLNAMARGVPDWIDQTIDAEPARRRGTPPVPQPRLIEMLGVRLVEDHGGPLDKVLLEISLRNMSPIPLALGGERTLNARLMLAPIIEIGARKVPGAASDVVSLERRLRLLPREQVVVRVWADPGFSGYFSEMAGGELTRMRWRVLQGFRFDSKGLMQVGPYSLSGETALYTRRTFPRSGESITDLAGVVRTCPAADFPALLGAVRWRLFRDENEELRLQPAERELMAAALSERYAAAGPDERLLMLSMLPASMAIRSLGRFDEAVMGVAETDARVALVRVATRVREKDSPALDAAEQSGDARLARTAQAMRTRLTSNPRTYSRFTFYSQ